MASSPLTGLPLGPVIEPSSNHAVITAKSQDLLKRGQFNAVPIIAGHTSLEGHSNDGLSRKYSFLYSFHIPFIRLFHLTSKFRQS